jgi:polyribonucleotide nucleotidyltransferase
MDGVAAQTAAEANERPEAAGHGQVRPPAWAGGQGPVEITAPGKGGKRVFRTELAGRPLVAEVGHVAKQANGAVLLRLGDTVVLVTATASRQPNPEADFLPLRTDYEERQYAAGRIPGSFFRREGRPSERATLTARLIDRPIRPLFPEGFRHDVQVVATVLSYDGENGPDVAGILGASIALSISDIPWNGPIAGVLVGLVDGQFVTNPTPAQLERSALELVVAGSEEAIIMVEAGADEVPEPKIVEALQYGHAEIRRLCAWQREIIAAVGKPKFAVTPPPSNPELEAFVRERAAPALRQVIVNPDKQARERAVEEVGQRIAAEAAERFPGPDTAKLVAAVLHEVEKEEVRALILDRGIRPDGRRLDEIRPIWCDVGFLPRAHGSGLFTRGQTQVINITTLGGLGDRQLVDAVGEREEYKRYMHHYNFPPYSTGEVRPMRGPGRREIGHGALAERALVRMIPPEEEFPYTLRLVSEVIESNGSTSMASVCGSTLSLMDAGVPIRRPVAGVAMGLVTEDGRTARGRTAILTDIQGIEDHLGDMDFKVAGTERGVTAIQMDIKISGVDADLLSRALEQARRGRLEILRKMLEVIPEPRKQLSPYAPRITVVQIDPDRIRDLIGPGGKTINKIIAETGAEIDVEDDGRVFIAAPTEEAGRRAEEWVRRLTRDPQPGEVYVGKVTRLMNFGAFVEILPGKDGLVHISELARERVPAVEDVVQVGDQVIVKVKEIDELGRLNLSRRAALETVPNATAQERIAPKERRRPEPQPAAAPKPSGQAQASGGGPRRDHAPKGEAEHGRPHPGRSGPERGHGGRSPGNGRAGGGPRPR